MIKRVPANFTLDELLAHLRSEKEEIQEGYFTTREWARHFGIKIESMRDILREAKEAKVLLYRRDSRERIDGPMCPVPVYAFDLGEEGEDGEGE